MRQRTPHTAAMIAIDRATGFLIANGHTKPNKHRYHHRQDIHRPVAAETSDRIYIQKKLAASALMSTCMLTHHNV